ncbi:MAG: twin-arginine translocase TatA/TatE family subunit [Candidatus Methylacidiphilales bacterium]|nr:twin-arginine translocase TatA/TatE family subunit [Candidatus Methylacidiphilales bacterium]
MTPILAFLPHGSEWLWITILVVVLFGAKKLPELARGLGRSVGEFKRAKQEFETELDDSSKPTLIDTSKPGATVGEQSKKSEVR